MIRLYLWFCRVLLLHADHGCGGHPAFPAPSSDFEGGSFQQLGHFVPRERGSMSAILSQPILRDAARFAPLLRMRSLQVAQGQTLMVRRRASAVSNHEAPRGAVKFCSLKIETKIRDGYSSLRVVPGKRAARPGIHNHRRIFFGGWGSNQVSQRRLVVMGPCFRRDDEGGWRRTRSGTPALHYGLTPRSPPARSPRGRRRTRAGPCNDRSVRWSRAPGHAWTIAAGARSGTPSAAANAWP